MKNVEQRGGKICVPKMAIPKVGWLAYAEDPAGNVFGIIEPDSNAKQIMSTKSNLTDAVVVERTLNAPIAKVWKALTDVDQMRQWYFDLRKFRPEVGFEFEFEIGRAHV